MRLKALVKASKTSPSQAMLSCEPQPVSRVLQKIKTSIAGSIVYVNAYIYNIYIYVEMHMYIRLEYLHLYVYLYV